jgi:hypothetical protein
VVKRSPILAIVPAFNETSDIRNVVRELGKVFPAVDVPVVNDESKDQNG